MSILALDLATNTGWAWGNLEDGPEYGSVRLPSTDRDIGRFGLAFKNWLEAKLDATQPSLIAVEEPIFPSKNTQIMTLRKLYVLAGIVEMVAVERKIKIFEETIGTIRVGFLGHNKVNKQMKPYPITFACQERGWDPKTTDEADALALWVHAYRVWEPERSLKLDPLFMG